MEDLARSLNLGVKEIKDRVAELHELNPMLGHRGCRLGIFSLKFMKCNVEQFYSSN